ncbi:MAG: hypothetical protein CVU17_09180 [Betaproteobacteria bacterium HGW-Betaproteobacteria-11]|nr:MAG: hypothetical protein CVU17_09180 [Betaproteobacteria bacterium HGW-Betaproteobacteria-11]
MRAVRRTGSLRIAFALSLLLHLVVLFVHVNLPQRMASSTQRGATQARLEAQLARPRAERGGEPQMPVATPRQETRKTSPAHGLWAARKWSRAERAEMADFLGTLARKPKPRSGRELAQQALAAAGKAGEAYEQENGDRGASLRSSPTKGKPIERISLDLYFDAFINKMNQSARSVKRPETSAGYGKALVEIAIGVDGSVTAFHVLRAANQQAEIEYVRAVVARASPFAVLPADFRATTSKLTIQMCVATQPGAGSGFSRSFGGQDCME